MKVTLKGIDRHNWRECIKLSTAPGQEKFVAPNIFSLAQAKAQPEMVPLAIYHEQEMIGFAMHALDPDDGQQWIVRLMIDRAQQGKGYGRAAMLELIDKLKRETACAAILLSCEPDNEVAVSLYLDLGFEQTGEVVEGENVMRLSLRSEGTEN